MRATALLVFHLVFSSTGLRAAGTAPLPSQPSLAFATYVGAPFQERAAAVWVDSIRRWGGPFRLCPIYIVLTDPENLRADRLKSRQVELISLQLSKRVLEYPFAAKAYAAAKAEELSAGKFRTLAWFDPETLLLQPPELMDMTEGADAAVNPVHLSNEIGRSLDEPLDAFWLPILRRCGLSPERLFPIETRVDSKTIRAYLNCGIFSLRPELRVLREWARLQDDFLIDQEFQHAACSDTKHRTFLHQAIFTAALLAGVPRSRIRFLPWRYGYPLHLHGRMPAEKKAPRLEELVTVFHESLWAGNEFWIDSLPPCREPLKSWLRKASAESSKEKGETGASDRDPASKMGVKVAQLPYR